MKCAQGFLRAAILQTPFSPLSTGPVCRDEVIISRVTVSLLLAFPFFFYSMCHLESYKNGKNTYFPQVLILKALSSDQNIALLAPAQLRSCFTATCRVTTIYYPRRGEIRQSNVVCLTWDIITLLSPERICCGIAIVISYYCRYSQGLWVFSSGENRQQNSWTNEKSFSSHSTFLIFFHSQ